MNSPDQNKTLSTSAALPYKTRNTCRVCDSRKLEAVLSLKNLYVSGFINSPEDQNLIVRAPLELILCLDCNLLQLKHSVNPELMYRHYWYRSVINSTMRVALADITASAMKRVELKVGDLVLDIGCNDGTLLRTYQKKDLFLMGFEPARNIAPDARPGTSLILNDFFNAKPFLEKAPKKAKIITSIAMFYDLENPNQFVGDIIQCLDENGIWIIQMAYLPSMIRMNAFDNICHEHLEYYSMLSLWNLLKRHHLKIFDVELNDVNGGSYRIYIKHDRCNLYETKEGKWRVDLLNRYERRAKMNHAETACQFAARVDRLKDQTYDFIKAQKKAGKRVDAYGASTKGNTLLQYYNLDHSLIHAVAERNPDKWGKFTVGSKIPIISEEQMRKERPDYLLVLPWHFMTEFLEREKDYLRAGGKFIAPLPEFKILPS